ncbi:hypothetical protein LMH87_002476 [Akanthomyces muscarius]|uniref:Uncharacterized protein n=2 Tax=Akanthomyces TaxID=150366 RepID=A0A162JZ16_CORDF|nr:hypothetical protein LMH87_002476 [Akanthomyces muscarius]KAJ4147986.1 hypothetical protein LMH87_002476 [Akanthomyces muscarius]OAA75542.1 hypothetical protein LEL_07530 [Akanthomyces lecanii RCEF 1005]
MQLTTALVAGLLSATALARSVPRAYPGINEEQSRNAGAAIWQVRNYRLGRQACLAVISTALQESELEVYANPRVPESYKYPHNREGGDQDSVGMFQQRKAYYPDIAADMDPARSTGQFLDAMLRVPGWQNMEISQLDQAVQHAEAGNLYGQRIPLATRICNAAGF